MTYWYEVYGIHLRSDIELSFVEGIPVGEPDVDLLSATEKASFARRVAMRY